MSIARLRSHSYRIYPTGEVIEVLNQWLGAARFIYNLGLEQRSCYARRISDGRWRHLSYVTQCRELTQLRAECSWLKAVPVHILQQSLKDLDRAYQNFFNRTYGYPKFRKRCDEESCRLSDPQTFSFYKTSKRMGKLKLPKMGSLFGKKNGLIDLRWDRSMSGEIRMLTITRKAGQWHVTIVFKDTVSEPLPNGLAAVGVDRGVSIPVALAWKRPESEWGSWERDTDEKALPFGSHVLGCEVSSLKTLPVSGFDPRNPGWATALISPQTSALNRALLARKKAQKRLSRQKKGSRNYQKQRILLAKRFLKESRIRKDFSHKVSYYLSQNHGQVIIEDLKIKHMTASSNASRVNKSRNRSILNSSWGLIETFLKGKCFWSGSLCLEVSPVNTSRTCVVCGSVSAHNRKGLRFSCLSCGYETHADTNAAQNIVCRRVGNPSFVCGEEVLEKVHSELSKDSHRRSRNPHGLNDKEVYSSSSNHGNPAF